MPVAEGEDLLVGVAADDVAIDGVDEGVVAVVFTGVGDVHEPVDVAIGAGDVAVEADGNEDVAGGEQRGTPHNGGRKG